MFIIEQSVLKCISVRAYVCVCVHVCVYECTYVHVCVCPVASACFTSRRHIVHCFPSTTGQEIEVPCQ